MTADSGSAGSRSPGASAPSSLELTKPGHLTLCIDPSNKPQAFLDPAGHLVGSDIELGQGIADKMHLALTVQKLSVAATVPAVVAGQCDLAISGMPITKVHEQQVLMIPYLRAGQAFVVVAGNPQKIADLSGLCGKAVSVVRGSAEADHLNPSGGSAYRVEEGLSAQCKAANRDAIVSVQVGTDDEALARLANHSVTAQFTREASAGYEILQGKGKFQMIESMTVERAEEGICVSKMHPGLHDAVETALDSLIADGSYAEILDRWGLRSDEITGTFH